MREAQPDDIGMSVSYPLPGTKFFRAVADQLGTKRNWVDSSDLEMMYRGPFSTAFYRKLHQVLHAEFRMRRSWRAFRGTPTRPAHLARAALHAAKLPPLRLQLELLARRPHRGLAALPRFMSAEAASRPSPQADADR